MIGGSHKLGLSSTTGCGEAFGELLEVESETLWN